MTPSARAIHQYFQDGDASRMLFPSETVADCARCGRNRKHRKAGKAYKAAGMWWHYYNCAICSARQSVSDSKVERPML